LSGYLSTVDGRVLPVRHGFVIGRVAGCDLVIDDGKASRRHARLLVEAGVVEIEDLDSSNGTMLNGKPVTRRVLRGGDQVQIGKTVITYDEQAPASARGTAASGAGGAAAPAPAAFDDNDLFGDGPAAESPMVSSPPPAAPPPPPPQPSSARQPRPPVPAAPPAPPAPPPARSSVVEFADEVVEVRKPAVAAATKGAPPAAGGVVQKQARVLQFSQQAGAGGVLGDDLGQMSGGTRALIYAAVLAAAGALAWFLIRAVR
jgi:predicted component of type VI protein secretion system